MSTSANESPNTEGLQHLVAVVGFDGSGPSYRALDAAVQLIAGRLGTVEVLYVAHIPAGAEMSPGAQVEARQGFDDAEEELREVVRARLEGKEQRWRFKRRDGLIAHELAAAAEQIRDEYGSDADPIIVVGSSAHTLHHVIGSVPVALVRHAKCPVMVVP